MRRVRLALVAAALTGCAGERPAPSPALGPDPPDGQVAADRSEKPDSLIVDPRELQRHTVLAGGHPLAVFSKRPPSPWAAVVLVHGRTWSSLPDFDLQVVGAAVSLMDALVDAGVVAYAVDLRGYGATPRDPSGWLTPDRAADDLAAVLRWTRFDSGLAVHPAALGWSLGARVVTRTAQRYPDLASALVLYGTPCSPPGRPPSPAAPPAPAPVGPPPERPNTEAAARSDFITPGAIDPAVADAFVRAALSADPVRAEWRDTDAWHELDFASLRAPILAIHGEHDPVVDAACLRARLDEVKGPRRVVVLDGADHAAHIERTAPAFAAAVVEFLKEHARARP